MPRPFRQAHYVGRQPAQDARDAPPPPGADNLSARLLALALAASQPPRRRRRRLAARFSAWFSALDPMEQSLVLAVPLAILLGVLASVVLGDRVWVPVTN